METIRVGGLVLVPQKDYIIVSFEDINGFWAEAHYSDKAVELFVENEDGAYVFRKFTIQEISEIIKLLNHCRNILGNE